jgi:hypothetical protein
MPQDRIESKGVEEITVQKARGGDTLFIDGNLDAFGTLFDHARHVDSLGQKQSCIKCHHMNVPLDKESGCWECHSSMYTANDIFRHDWHASPNGATIACDICHKPEQERQKASAKECRDCHIDLYADSTADTLDTYLAVSYVDAMHILCVDCHRGRAVADTTRVALAQCPACHTGPQPDYLKAEMADELSRPAPNHVMMPPAVLQVKEE